MVHISCYDSIVTVFSWNNAAKYSYFLCFVFRIYEFFITTPINAASKRVLGS